MPERLSPNTLALSHTFLLTCASHLLFHLILHSPLFFFPLSTFHGSLSHPRIIHHHINSLKSNSYLQRNVNFPLILEPLN
ncbi:hypothetical protein L6452_09870 [Arctium lappa]|uniref:Uncharacterized protein n=1 Tax=Arctium lappa TaxID=4217 RepID=A0ACB9DL76_ARCLA|nr:hypothetical protein L6452_09870 [Arctium lappa]